MIHEEKLIFASWIFIGVGSILDFCLYGHLLWSRRKLKNNLQECDLISSQEVEAYLKKSNKKRVLIKTMCKEKDNSIQKVFDIGSNQVDKNMIFLSWYRDWTSF